MTWNYRILKHKINLDDLFDKMKELKKCFKVMSLAFDKQVLDYE